VSRPTVFVCDGSTCSETKAWRKLGDSLDEYAHVSNVRCQKICNGPVCGTLVSGQLVWFEDVAGEAVRAELRQLATDGVFAKRLLKRVVKKRNNKLR
jgi:hypothetical protein